MHKSIAYNVNINLADAGMQRLRFVFNADIAYYERLCALLHLHEVPGLGLVHVGREHDGGYLMLDDFRGEDDGRRIAYSFGISDDVSWDLAMAERGYDVYMYDHTIEACPGSHERFHYHKLGIGARSEPENLLCTLGEILAVNGHEQAEHMILKMDVEGAEWQVLDLLPDSVLQRFDQIVLELHWLVTSMEEGKNAEMLRVLSRLGRMHALVHLHGNNNASHLELGEQAIPDVIEVTYVSRRSYQARALRSAVLPSSLDMPNCAALPEIILGSWTGDLQGMDEWKGGINMQLSGTEWGGYRWDKLLEERLRNPLCLESYGYKAYSQNDEDGIIEEIFARIGTTDQRFIEFGVQDGTECNTHLLLHKGWQGLWLEGDETAYRQILAKFKPVIGKAASERVMVPGIWERCLGERLRVMNAFITKDNINQLLYLGGMEGSVDLLSIDVDGNDYHIWQTIRQVDPRVVVIEYNGKFPPSVEWKMGYDPGHVWLQSDWHGASLKALEKLGKSLGYQLVGTDMRGVNAFFVKQELAAGKFAEPATTEYLYNPLRLGLSYANGHPADVCLCQQKDNEGMFCYEPERLLTKIYGFHAAEEAVDAGSAWTFMSGRAAAFILNPAFLTGKQNIRFDVLSGAWVAGGTDPKVYFGIGNMKLVPMPPVAEQENEIILPIVRQNEQEPYVVEVRLDITPEQSEELRGGDGHQGFGLRLGQLRVE